MVFGGIKFAALECSGQLDCENYFDTEDTEKIVRKVDNVVNEIEYEAALEAKAVNGIENVLEFVRSKNLKQAIYTFNTYKNAKTSLEKIGMLHYFDVIVGRDHVKNTKPHPEHLTTICNRLLVNSSNIIVIGDNHRDIEGALNVGAKSIAIKTKLTKLTNSEILEKNPSDNLIMNFEKTKYINSSGIASLISIIQNSNERNVKISFVGMSSHFQKVMDIVGIIDFIEIYHTNDEALENIKK